MKWSDKIHWMLILNSHNNAYICKRNTKQFERYDEAAYVQ